jgi:putative phosphoesterase
VILGIISDTHGLLRPEALAALAGACHIVHAGDVGCIAVLDALRAIAPVTAVRGNVDTAAELATLPRDAGVTLAGVSIYVLHDAAELDIDPAAARFNVVVTGHSHRPAVAERNGVLHINPGAAGPRRFRLPVTLATLDLTRRPLAPLLHTLVPPA